MATSFLLICAVLASLAAGVLIAYGICLAMFQIFQMQSQAVARQRLAASALRVALD